MACYFSLKESVHSGQDLYLLSTISAFVEKDGRIPHIQEILLLCCPTFLQPLQEYLLWRWCSYFFYFSVSMFFSFAVFFVWISAHSAGFVFMLPLDEELNIRLMRLWIIRQKGTIFFAIWLLSSIKMFPRPDTMKSQLCNSSSKKDCHFHLYLAFNSLLV